MSREKTQLSPIVTLAKTITCYSEGALQSTLPIYFPAKEIPPSMSPLLQPHILPLIGRAATKTLLAASPDPREVNKDL